jgi:hypothetical protein
VAVSSEHINETSGTTTGGEFRDHLSDYQLLKTSSFNELHMIRALVYISLTGLQAKLKRVLLQTAERNTARLYLALEVFTMV